MFMPERLFCVGGLLIGLAAAPAGAAAVTEGPRLGQPASAASIAARDLSVFPDGSGLPPGQGSVETGKAVYQTRCATCHGPGGIGGSAEELIGQGRLDGPTPDKSLGNYWPYATTVFDFVRRAMPLDRPGSLDDAEVYAVTAYLLYLNRLIPADTVLTADNLPRLVMPNRNGFVSVWPEQP
ncbi:c-type cytochrome [Candidatus Woesearchaeota archaeon]|nr:c-type cytochrome [Candidatus Woesearchaeota archaeon]